MPIIRVELIEGRTPELKEDLIAALCEATIRTLDVKAESVRVILYEIPKTHFSIAGKSVAKRDKEAKKE
jgi:4-oxalocrotonate tautomerase